MKKCQNQALMVLAGIILIRGFASGGVNMTASLYLAPVCRELGVGLGTLSLYFSIMSVVTVLWLPGAGRLINCFPVQVLALAAAAFHSLSFAALGLMDHVAGWYLLCIPQAMGATILISLMGSVLINRWFPHNTGTAAFTQHIPNFGILMGYSVSQAGFAMSFISLGSALGSLAIGLVSDRIGSLKTCYGIIGLWVLAVAGFAFSGMNFWYFAAAAFLHGAASSSIAVIAPILTLVFYGKQDYEKIFAKVSMGAPLASILLIPAYGFIYDATGGYGPVLVLMIFLLAAAAAGIFWGWKLRCTAAGCPTWRKY